MNIEELKLKKNPRLIISKEIQSQIDFLHRKINKTEWSGILFFKVIDGSIKTPSKLILKAHSLYLMDIGTSAYTEYNSGDKLIEAFDTIKDSELMSYGHIHTHHNMSTFFSQTDNDELIDNAKNFNYYLSLIVNFDFTYKAAIAIETDVIKTIEMFDEEHKKNSISIKSKSLIKIDCDIIFEKPSFEVSTVYEKIVEENKKKKALQKTTQSFNNVMGFQKHGTLFENQLLGKNNFSKKSLTETNSVASEETGALAILSSININYVDIEELTASIVSMDLNCQDTVSDALDKAFKKRQILSNEDKDDVDEFANMAIETFIGFNNIDLPQDILHDAVIECLEINKDLSVTPIDRYNDFIDEYIDAIIFVQITEE